MVKEKSAKLVLLRHGQSVWNAQNLFTGWVDIPLSSKGIEEALKAGERISHIPFDLIYTSTLVRAQMTAFLSMSRHALGKVPCVVHEDCKMSKIYSEEAEENTIPTFCHAELNERMYGKLQGLNKEETKQKFGEKQFLLWRRSYATPPPDGESLEMTAKRTIPFFEKEILPKLYAGKNILISAHGNSLRSIVMFLDKLSEDAVTKLEIPTGEPLCYAFHGKKFKKQAIDLCNKEYKSR